MIYKDVNGRMFQYHSEGVLVLTVGMAHLTPPANLDGATVVVARDIEGKTWVYLESVFEERSHWTAITRKATLFVEDSLGIKDGDGVVVYRSEDAQWYVRPVKEFWDGRFHAFAGVVELR